MVSKGDPELSTHGAEVPHHAVDIIRTKELGQRPSFRRRFRVDLHSPPFNRKVELLLQLFDDALADVAEGSDVVGEDCNADGHGVAFLRGQRMIKYYHGSTK